METIEEAKQFLRDNWEAGTTCPCCNQVVKLYKRRLNAGACRALVLMYKITKKDNPENGWIHVQRAFAWHYGLNANSMDYSQPQWWRLIEKQDKESGYWRLTDSGKRFVERRIKVQTHVKLFNNKSYGYIGEEVSIDQALGKKFDYEELMEGFMPYSNQERLI